MSGRPLHATILPTGRALLDLLSGALDGGPAIAPIDPQSPPAARDRLVTALRPGALVTPEGTRPLAGGVPVGDEVAVVMATSGSTGDPKGVELSAAALRASATATLQRIGARPGERWLCCLPTCHVGGLQVLVRSLVAGSEPVLVERFSVAAVAAAVSAGAVEHTALVPTTLRRALDAGVDLGSFRTVLVGGAPLTPDLRERALTAGAPVVATYGMTETAGGCVYEGLPLDDVSVQLDGDGRVRLAGPVLAGGYRLRPDLTAESFVDGWLVTHDAGRLTADGRLEVLGRLDDIIMTGGVNVAAADVAEHLASHPAVAQVGVIARPDAEWGQRVVAVVAPVDPADPPTLAELRDHVTAAAAPALAPRELVLVEALPLLPSGKVDRQAVGKLAP